MQSSLYLLSLSQTLNNRVLFTIDQLYQAAESWVNMGFVHMMV